MTSRNLARRLEWLDESLLPTNEEPLGMRIESVSPEGERVDSGIEFRILAAPKPIYEKRCAVKAIAKRLRRLINCRPWSESHGAVPVSCSSDWTASQA
jgi:hypothetical protein